MMAVLLKFTFVGFSSFLTPMKFQVRGFRLSIGATMTLSRVKLMSDLCILASRLEMADLWWEKVFGGGRKLLW